MNQYYVYILASNSRVLYIGVTNNLSRRMFEHRQGDISGFSKDYQTSHLVYYEMSSDINDAIAREKQLKNWRRDKKIALIEVQNPGWADLADVVCG